MGYAAVSTGKEIVVNVAHRNFAFLKVFALFAKPYFINACGHA